MAGYLHGAPSLAGSGPGNPFVAPNHFATSYGSQFNKSNSASSPSRRVAGGTGAYIQPYAPVQTDLPYAPMPGIGQVEDGFVGEVGEVGSRGIDRMVTCYCCGRGYSTASLPRHLNTCPAQRDANYRSLPPQLRPPMPLPPSLPVPTDRTSTKDIAIWNEQSTAAYRASMATCPTCGRKFEPDRLEAHMRGCKGVQPSAQHSSGHALAGGAAGAAKVHYPVYKKPAAAAGSRDVEFDPSVVPPEYAGEPQYQSPPYAGASRGIERMVTCYCCGQQFSTFSIGRHVSQCPTQRDNDYRQLQMRPQPLVAPSMALPTNGSSTQDITKYNALATESYRNAMAACYLCGRKFEPDRLGAHMKGCKGVHVDAQKSAKPGLGAGAAGASKVHYPVYKKPASVAPGARDLPGYSDAPRDHLPQPNEVPYYAYGGEQKEAYNGGAAAEYEFDPSVVPAEYQDDGAQAEVGSRDIARMVTCYCCGGGYGSSSIARHMTQCPTQRENDYRHLPANLKPPPPRMPQLPVPNDKTPTKDIAIWNEQANAAYRASMASCPSCGRKFEPDRIETHMRGCKGAAVSAQKKIPGAAIGGGAQGAAKVHYPVYKKPAATAASRDVEYEFDPSAPRY